MDSDSDLRISVVNAELKCMIDPDEYDSSEETDRPNDLRSLCNFLSLCYSSTNIVFIFIPDHIFNIIFPPEDKSTYVKKISITYNISEKKYEITRFKEHNVAFANDPIFFNTTDDIDNFISSYLTKK